MMFIEAKKSVCSGCLREVETRCEASCQKSGKSKDEWRDFRRSRAVGRKEAQETEMRHGSSAQMNVIRSDARTSNPIRNPRGESAVQQG